MARRVSETLTVDIDELLQQIKQSHNDIAAHKSSMVKLRAHEIDMLRHMESFRDSVRATLKGSSSEDGRGKLNACFGGDCVRIATFRAIIDATTFSTMNACDKRIPDSSDACEEMEGVLKDMGLGRTLEKEKEKMRYEIAEEAAKAEAERLALEAAKAKASGDADAIAAAAAAAAAAATAAAAAAAAKKDAEDKAREEAERRAKLEEEARQKTAADDEARRAAAEPIYDWKRVQQGDPVPEGAVLSGKTKSDGDVYVARDMKGELGKLNLLRGKVNNIWCHEGGKSKDTLPIDVLVLCGKGVAEWKSIHKGNDIPMGAVLGGATVTDGGEIYVARVKDGECGKLNVNKGKAHNIWVHSAWMAHTEGEILCIHGGASGAAAGYPSS